MIGIIISSFLVITAGCDSLSEPLADPVIEEPPAPDSETDEEPSPEDSLAVTTYYWPWISHGQVVLSSGEIIIGPDLFESDPGFIGEFVPGTNYDGRLLWRVENTDLLLMEWITLTFDVDYYIESEWESTSTFHFQLNDLQPEPMNGGRQQLQVNLSERKEDFEVTIKQLYLGIEEVGNIAKEPISYIAFDIEMKVVDNPE